MNGVVGFIRADIFQRMRSVFRKDDFYHVPVPSCYRLVKLKDRHSIVPDDTSICFLILYVGRPLFIPLSFALLISCILYPICIWLEQRKVKKMTAIILSLSLIVLLLAAILFLFFQQLISFSSEWPALQLKLSQAFSEISSWITHKFSISAERQAEWFENASRQSGSDAMGFVENYFSEISEYCLF